MTEAKINEINGDIEELTGLMQQAKRRKVQDILSLEIRKLETEVINLREAEQKAAAAATPSSSTATALQSNKRYQVKLNGYGWDQSDKYIKVFVTLKNVQNVPKERVYCKLTETSMELHVDDLDNKDYVLLINKLLEPINIEESHWKQKTDMVVVFLAKAAAGVKWSHMTALERRADDQRAARFKTDDVANKDPQESIMGLMKNMYESGDDEMKRMITKAWYEGQQKKKTSEVDL